MKNVLITGANRGLGLGFTKTFLEKNVKVFCTTRNISKSNDLMKYQRKYPNYLEICELDLIAENSSNVLTNFLNFRNYTFNNDGTNKNKLNYYTRSSLLGNPDPKIEIKDLSTK